MTYKTFDSWWADLVESLDPESIEIEELAKLAWNATLLSEHVQQLEASHYIKMANQQQQPAEPVNQRLVEALTAARVVLDDVQGNINQERGFADDLECDVKNAIEAINEVTAAAAQQPQAQADHGQCHNCGKRAQNGWALMCVACAGLLPKAPVVPDGYALVPIEPTQNIVRAMALEVQGKGGWLSGDTYRAMLAAAKGEK